MYVAANTWNTVTLALVMAVARERAPKDGLAILAVFHCAPFPAGLVRSRAALQDLSMAATSMCFLGRLR